VGEWVSDGGEAAFEQLGEALVLGPFGVGFEKIQCENGRIDGKDFVYQCGTIAFDVGEFSNALGEPFGGLKNRMEVVVLEEFGSAIFGDFRMNGSTPEHVLYGSKSCLRLVKRGGRRNSAKLTIFYVFQSR